MLCLDALWGWTGEKKDAQYFWLTKPTPTNPCPVLWKTTASLSSCKVSILTTKSTFETSLAHLDPNPSHQQHTRGAETSYCVQSVPTHHAQLLLLVLLLALAGNAHTSVRALAGVRNF